MVMLATSVTRKDDVLLASLLLIIFERPGTRMRTSRCAGASQKCLTGFFLIPSCSAAMRALAAQLASAAAWSAISLTLLPSVILPSFLLAICILLNLAHHGRLKRGSRTKYATSAARPFFFTISRGGNKTAKV